MPESSIRWRRGTTLVEALVASAVFLVASVGIYQLFITGQRTTAVGMWYSASNTDLRNGLRLLREDLMKASYPSEVTASGTNIDRSAAYHLSAVDGRTDLAGTTGGGGNLLEFHMCSPSIDVGGIDPSPGVQVRCQLRAEGNTLVYIREGGDNPMNRVIIRDVDYVDITREPHPDDDGTQLVTIEIGTVHPRFEQTRAVERTSAKVEVQ